MENYVEKWKIFRCSNAFFSTGNDKSFKNFSTEKIRKEMDLTFQQVIFPQKAKPVENLQTGVNICRNIPNVVLQLGITGFQRAFYFIDGIKNGGVVFIKFLADIRGRKVG